MSDALTIYDPAEDLKSEMIILDFITEAHRTGDAGYIAHAEEVVARAKRLNGQTDR